MNRLPIYDVIAELKTALNQQPLAILNAEPGSGKTTVVPLELLNEPWLQNKTILMLEPRRLAARAAANRMAQTLNENTGHTVGYQVRMDKNISANTRIEVVTEGILTRRIQSDPELTGVGLIIFDEFHERSLHSDLAFALALDCAQGLRDDLRLLLMSATLDIAGLKKSLGDIPTISGQGQCYPVETIYLGEQKGRFQFQTIVNNAVTGTQAAFKETSGDILVFLPGSGEIRAAEKRLLENSLLDAEIFPLYGELSKSQQDAAIQTGGGRKIVLSTSIAETSLTIEGITAVVDCGYSRLPGFNPNNGLTGLETVRASKAAAEQRRGRAGRVQAGNCYRMWSADLTLAASHPAEIEKANLAPLALEIAAWGSKPEDLTWVTAPPVANLQQAQHWLQQAGALADNLAATAHGQRMNQIGGEPRFANMIIQAKHHGDEWLATACDLAALLSEKDIIRIDRDNDIHHDVAVRLQALNQYRNKQALSSHIDKRATQWAFNIAKQWRQKLNVPVAENNNPDLTGVILAWAYSDRIATKRSIGTGYTLANGRGAELASGSDLTGQTILVIANTGNSGTNSKIRLAAAISFAELEKYHGNLIEQKQQCGWDKSQQRVTANDITAIGAAVLACKKSKNISQETIASGLIQGIRDTGIHCLPWDKAATALKHRLQFASSEQKDWPEFSDTALLDALGRWLAPHILGISKLEQLQKLNLSELLLWRLDYSQQQMLNQLAPEKVTVPSGSQIKLDYSSNPPVLAVKIQEMFGLTSMPLIGNTPVKIHLLSPARRPLAVTQDLASFWQNAYPEVKKEMKGRYPKHYWPDNPLEAAPRQRSTDKS